MAQMPLATAASSKAASVSGGTALAATPKPETPAHVYTYPYAAIYIPYVYAIYIPYIYIHTYIHTLYIHIPYIHTLYIYIPYMHTLYIYIPYTYVHKR